MRKFALLISFIAFLWMLNGCSGGGGGDNNQTGNRGAPGNALDGTTGVPSSTEFLMEHDGDGVNPFTGFGLADDAGITPGIVEFCTGSPCASWGIIVKFKPTVAITTPFTIRSLSYFVPTACGGDASVAAEFVVYEGGSDFPGIELIRVPMPLDTAGGTAAAASDELKVFEFSPALILGDLLGGDVDGTFYAGVEFMNTTTGTFLLGFDIDPTPFPDPAAPWVASDPYPGPPTCPAVLPESLPPTGSVPPTACMDPLTFAGGRGTTYTKCAGSSYSPLVSATTPFGPLADVIFTLEIGP